MKHKLASGRCGQLVGVFVCVCEREREVPPYLPTIGISSTAKTPTNIDVYVCVSVCCPHYWVFTAKTPQIPACWCVPTRTIEQWLSYVKYQASNNIIDSVYEVGCNYWGRGVDYQQRVGIAYFAQCGCLPTIFVCK